VTRSTGEQSRQTEPANRAGAAVSAAVRAGKATGRVQPPLLATQVVGIAYPGDILAMVTTRGKAVARRSVGTQTEAPRKNAGVQVSGCLSA